LIPELLLVDGNGILHTRNFGCASHIGVVFDIPTIGVGKTVFYIDGIKKETVKELSEQNLHKAGDLVELRGNSGKVWGVALRSTDESMNPVIVSQGHRVSLQTAIDATLACIDKFRIPEPIRQADLRSRQLVKKYFS
jgi:endonuclease V